MKEARRPEAPSEVTEVELRKEVKAQQELVEQLVRALKAPQEAALW